MVLGCTLKVLQDLFGVSKSLAFNKIVKIMVFKLIGELYKAPNSKEERIAECKGQKQSPRGVL